MPKHYATAELLKDDVLPSLSEKDETLILTGETIEDDEHKRFKYKTIKGTDSEETIVKIFNDTLYTSPTKKDFQERINSIIDAAKTIPDINEKQKARLETLREKAFEDLEHKQYTIKPTTIDDLTQEENILIIEAATKLMQGIVYHSLLIINPDISSAEELKETRKLLEKREAEMIADQGRPNHLNFYPVKKTDGTIVMRYSLQMTVADKTIPSTVRDRAKLPNHVYCETGSMQGNKFEPDFPFYRHSSYPPIMIPDEYVRRQNAAVCVKDHLRVLVERAIAKGIRTDSPITLNISSLGLLSPTNADALLVKLGRRKPEEDEFKQLKESYDALMMYDGREISIDGVTVIPNINLVNVPVNAPGIFLTRHEKPKLEKRINMQGMNQFITEVQAHCKNKGSHLFSLDDTYTIARLKRTTALKATLATLNQQLEALLTREPGSADEHYKTKINQIDACRKTMFALEDQIMVERKTIFESLREGCTQTPREQIKAYLSTDHHDPRDELLELYYQSVAMYMDGAVEPTQFGARFLLAKQKMGHQVDFFCKSGEDRTGRMQNFFEELCAFSNEHGRYPKYDFETKILDADDEQKRKEIALQVNAGSCSLDNTRDNAHGCPGLQIEEICQIYQYKKIKFEFKAELNSGLPCKPMKAQAGMAKGVYEKEDLKALWYETHPLEEEKDAHLRHFTPAARTQRRIKYAITTPEHDFMALLLESSSSKKTKAEIRTLNRISHDEGTSRFTAAPSGVVEKIKLTGKLDDMKFFKTSTGMKIKTIGTKNNTFQMDIPRKNPLADIKMLALRVQASGSDTIQMNIEEKDPKRAKKLARAAYKACRLIGREEGQITLFINGKKITMTRLFKGKGDENKKAQIDTKANILAMERKATDPDEPEQDISLSPSVTSH